MPCYTPLPQQTRLIWARAGHFGLPETVDMSSGVQAHLRLLGHEVHGVLIDLSLKLYGTAITNEQYAVWGLPGRTLLHALIAVCRKQPCRQPSTKGRTHFMSQMQNP